MVLGIEPSALCMPSICCSNEVNCKHFYVFKNLIHGFINFFLALSRTYGITSIASQVDDHRTDILQNQIPYSILGSAVSRCKGCRCLILSTWGRFLASRSSLRLLFRYTPPQCLSQHPVRVSAVNKRTN